MLTEQEINANKEAFISVFTDRLGNRQGAIAMLDWLMQSTFFIDPASTKYHECYPGGLIEHTLKVANALVNICYELTPYTYTTDTLYLVSLLHDVCKIGCYKKSFRNVKSYEKEDLKNARKWEIKNDALGDFIWKSEESYIFEDDFPLGHGEKSVFLIQRFMPLTDEEALAIRYHMGAWDEGDKRPLAKAFEISPLVSMLNIADTFATYLKGIGETEFEEY